MIVTDSIIRRAEEIYRDFECAKLRAYQSRPENPNRIGFEKFGSAVATLGPGVAYFNRVYGFTEEQTPLLPEIIGFYRPTRTNFGLTLSPLDATDAVGNALVENGFVPGHYHTKLFADPAEIDSAGSEVAVSLVTAAELDLFLEVMLEGWGLPLSAWEGAKTNMRLRFRIPGVSLFLGSSGGSSVGGGILYCRGNDAYLADAATVPGGRNCGCHQALIRARCAKAVALGCKRVFGCAQFGSSSFRNMQRAGLRIAFSDIVWRYSFAD